MRVAYERKAVGYAIVWLASSVVGKLSEIGVKQHSLDPDIWLGSDAQPEARLVLRDTAGAAKAHVGLVVRDEVLYYQAFRHGPAGPAVLVFEGTADPEGFDFCLEFLSTIPAIKSEKAANISLKINEGIRKHYEQQIRIAAYPNTP
jgi:hypothetical protein